MAVVALIPTGSMEHLALAPSLGRIFPDHTFVVLPAERHMDGFTSCDLSQSSILNPNQIPTTLQNLVTTLVNAIFPGRRGKRIDFAYVVEDVELFNNAHPEVVLTQFREVVKQCVESQWPQQTEPRFEQVRQRCAFHLFRPMTETYFFGDPEALTRAKVLLQPQLPADVDLERFHTIDQTYLKLPPNTKDIKDMPQREIHPKSFIHYLCDPTLSDKKLRYRETHGGRAALESLNWELVLQHSSHCPFLTALLDDLCQALDCILPYVDSAKADPRVRVFGTQNRILRNI